MDSEVLSHVQAKCHHSTHVRGPRPYLAHAQVDPTCLFFFLFFFCKVIIFYILKLSLNGRTVPRYLKLRSESISEWLYSGRHDFCDLTEAPTSDARDGV